MTVQEHVTALFAAGVYYWLLHQHEDADICFRAAVDVLETVSFVGDA